MVSLLGNAMLENHSGFSFDQDVMYQQRLNNALLSCCTKLYVAQVLHDYTGMCGELNLGSSVIPSRHSTTLPCKHCADLSLSKQLVVDPF